MKAEIPEPSKLRRYFVEYTVIALAVTVTFLTYEILDLNKFIRDRFYQVIQDNTRTIEKFNIKNDIR